MAGASTTANRIVTNIGYKIDNHLEHSRCETYTENVKLRADEQTFYYPDVMIACDENPESNYYREVPILLVEVLSPLTERADRNEKLVFYKSTSSLQAYLIVWQDKMHVEIHRRQADKTWMTYIYGETDRSEAIELQSVGLNLTLAELYRRVDFTKQSSEFQQ